MMPPGKPRRIKKLEFPKHLSAQVRATAKNLIKSSSMAQGKVAKKMVLRACMANHVPVTEVEAVLKNAGIQITEN